MNNILIVPCCEKGYGGGHLTRCANLTRELRALGRNTLLYIYKQNDNISRLLERMDFNKAWLITDTFSLPKIEFIILDRFQTPRDELARWKKIAPVIGIDEGGKCRDGFDFLIDMLIPENFVKHAANITSPKLLIKNLNTEYTESHGVRKDYRPINSVNSVVSSSLKILISFGQEDSAGLGLKTARALGAMNNKFPMNITLLRGALASSIEIPENVNVMDNIPNLAQRLHEYDLVITHYGITAYEALFAGVNVLLDHPSAYHKKLAKAAGFKTFTQKNFIAEFTELHGEIERKQSANSVKLRGFNFENETLAGLINNFTPTVNRYCPVCNSENTYVIARFSDRTYRRCSRGGLIFMDRLNPPPIEYEKEYFFESYKKQYGKTYLEDFDNIKQAGKQRLKRIVKILPRAVRESLRSPCEKNSKPNLLDIGCAYGPFLDAARDESFSVFGIDPAKDAVDYVQQKLGIEAEQGLFPFSYSTLSDSQHYTIVTLWYVIEHFTECKIILNEIKRILKPGGVLAFSTPSFSGITGSSNLKKFLTESPSDHFTIWSPKIVKKVLSLTNFKVKKIVVSGHHPERFPVIGRFAKSKKNPLYLVLLIISKLFGLGDTFEVYAMSKEE
ncbi:MAG: methyltransferase domain-containing protein [Treponema sp.]|nr:methyltransferase domain-containing protein [Treponema sp.]